MWRTALGAVVGMFAGVGATALLLRAASAALAALTAPKAYEAEHSTVILALVLGAGFGSLCGALAGLAGALLREWRRGASPPAGRSAPP